MGMLSNTFFKKVVFLSLFAVSLFSTSYPSTIYAAGSGGIGLQNGFTSSYQYQPPTTQAAPSSDIEFGCSILEGFKGIGGCFLALFYHVVVSPISWGLGVTSLLFNFAFEMSMDAGVATAPDDENGQPGSIFADGFIRVGWLAVRDLINITFIFALLQVAILLIIGKGGGYQDRLKNIIIAAIFINFSFFIVTEAIRLSNTFTRAVYDQIVNKGTGIADGFTTATGISGFGSEAKALSSWAAENPWAVFLYLVFSTILMVGFIGILLMSTAMFVSRYIVLVLCVVFSPALFLGLIWPKFENRAEEIKQTLIGQLLFPILYLLLIWVGLNFINVQKTTDSILQINNKQQFLDFGQQVKEIVFRFLVASALFITALTTAKKYSQMGSKGVSRIQGAIGKGIGTVAFGGTAMLGRNVIGAGVGGSLREAGARLSSVQGKTSGNLVVQKISQGAAAVARGAGRATSVVGGSLENRTYDVRSGRTWGAIGKETGVGSMYGSPSGITGRNVTEKTADKNLKAYEERKAMTTSEKNNLVSAQVSQEKAKKTREDEFKAAHNTSAKDMREAVSELSKTLANTKQEHNQAKNDLQDKQKMLINSLEAKKLTTNDTNTHRAIDDAIRTARNNKKGGGITSKGFKDSLEKLNDTNLNAALDEIRAADTAQQVIAVKASALNKERLEKLRLIEKLDTDLKSIDKEFAAKEKSIKEAGKTRAAEFAKKLGITDETTSVPQINQKVFEAIRASKREGHEGKKK